MMSAEDYHFCEAKALELFAHGQAVALSHGLILVDTKYEFGKDCDVSVREKEREKEREREKGKEERNSHLLSIGQDSFDR